MSPRNCLMIMIVTTGIMLLYLSAPTIAAQNTAELFLIPDQGFVRVNAYIHIPGSTASIEFALFPGAQITALWTDNLINYYTHSVSSATVVSIELNPLEEEQTLELSYEGFLPNYYLDPQAVLDQQLAWFPIFNKAQAHDYLIKITLPRDYYPKMQGELLEMRESAFATFKWQVSNSLYPIIWFGDNVPDQIPEQEPSEELVESVITLPESSVPEHDETEMEEEPDINADDENKTDQADPTIEGIIHEEPVEPVAAEIPLTDILTRFDQAVSMRDPIAIRQLIHPRYAERQELVDYLINRPGNLNIIQSQVIDYYADSPAITINSIMLNNGEPEFRYCASWLHENGTWWLTAFTQIPYDYQFASEINDTAFQQWAFELQRAILDFDLQWLDYHFSFHKLAAVQFLKAVYEQANITTTAVNLEYNQLVLLLQTQLSKFKLTLTYRRNGATWIITSFNVEPLL